jgi:uncharacterized protein YodC (DUF2158 family)
MKDELGLHRATFRVEDLRVVSDAPPPDSPPLAIGDWCRLNSGSPDLLVVDDQGARLVASWLDGEGEVNEADFPRAGLRRIDRSDRQ